MTAHIRHRCLRMVIFASIGIRRTLRALQRVLVHLRTLESGYFWRSIGSGLLSTASTSGSSLSTGGEGFASNRSTSRAVGFRSDFLAVGPCGGASDVGKVVTGRGNAVPQRLLSPSSAWRRPAPRSSSARRHSWLHTFHWQSCAHPPLWRLRLRECP